MSEPPFEPVSEVGARVVAAAKRAYLAQGPSAGVQAALRARIEARARRWKLGAGLALLLGLGASYAGLSHGPRTAEPVESTPAPSAPSPPARTAAEPSPGPTPAPEPAPAAHAARPARAAKKRAADSAPGDTLSELTLLTRARAALAAAPRSTLALCAEHRRTYPRGVLVEERELLAVEALAGLGERAALARRAQAFVRAFPGSLHLTRVRALRAALENAP